MKFCICFFGVIGRSLNYTIDSINQNIFKVLKDNKIKYDVFTHNNHIDMLTYRSRGENCLIDNSLHKLLNPKVSIKDIQDDFDRSYNWKPVFKNGDYYKNNFACIKNAIRQLFSLKRVTSLWENKEKYDLYLYLRPDLKYTNKLDIPFILKHIDTKDILFTPWWGKHEGLNDRIYFAKYHTMLKIAKRIDLVNELMSKTKIRYHPEGFMHWVVKKYNIKTIDINLMGRRIRATGRMERGT